MQENYISTNKKNVNEVDTQALYQNVNKKLHLKKNAFPLRFQLGTFSTSK